MKKFSVHQLTACGVLAALYAAITLTTSAFAYGPIQFRVADALCVLPFFLPWTTWGVTLGCFVANCFSPMWALDVPFGTLATLLACLWTAKLKNPWLIPIPTIVSNGVIVGGMLAVTFTPEAMLSGFLTMGGQVALGEIGVMFVVGMGLVGVIKKQKLLQSLGFTPRL